MYKLILILCVVIFKSVLIRAIGDFNKYYLVVNTDDFDNILVKPKVIKLDDVKSTLERKRRNADRMAYANLESDIGNKIFSPSVTTLQVEDWILVLEENRFISFGNDFKEKWTSNNDARNETYDQNECQFLSGYVFDDPDSISIITICNHMYYYGFFETAGKSYFVEPTVHPIDGHIVYKAQSNNGKMKRCADCQVQDRFNLTADISLDDINYNFEDEDEEVSTDKSTIYPETEYKEVDQYEEDDDVGYFIDTVWQTRPHTKSSKTTSRFKERWLELGLAVDHTVINFHGKNKIRQYIMSLMNIVSVIYQDPSLDANLHLVLARIIFFEDKKDSQIKIGNAKKSLEAVNRWNYRMIGSLPKGEKSHDIAVWLTREYIGGPSGYAPVAGVCDRTRSTALNKDEGLPSAFIIAHEVAHILGLTHDGDKNASNNCADEVEKGTIMSPTVTATFNRFAWSSCSREEFHKQIKQWTCLLDPPKNKNQNTLESGETYKFTMDEQCRMEYGEGYSLCKSFELIEPCTYLWCGRENTSRCMTKKGPPVDGTQCGSNKWCMDGYCQPVNKVPPQELTVPTPSPIDGVWGPWSPWGECSRSCGYGVQRRYRKCDNPPPERGGAECEGDTEDMKICKHEKKCWEPPVTDVRAEYCSRLESDEPDAIDWLPYDTEDEELKCYVNCILWDRGEVMRSGKLSPDGTPCSYDNEHHICIKGKCHKLGCDGIENSTLVEDVCGICGGNGRSCITSNQVFGKFIKKDMTKLVLLPRESRAISLKVTIHPSTETNQILPDSMFYLVLKGKASNFYRLAAKDAQNVVQFLRRRPEPANMIRAAEEVAVVVGGSAIRPARTPGTLTLTATGPLNADIIVLISAPSEYLQNVEASVQLNYTMPRTLVSAKGRYVWMVRQCHCGIRPLGPLCLDTLRSNQIVDSYKCPPDNNMVAVNRDCDNLRCEFRWVAGEWEYCSATCGDKGTSHRQIYCVPITVNDATLGDKPWIYMVEPNRCDDARPAEDKPCNRTPCPAYWIEEPWTTCTATCGPGISMRPMKCSRKEQHACGLTTPKSRWRSCNNPCTNKLCVQDKSKYCTLSLIMRYCVLREFQKLCCVSCANWQHDE